MSYSKLPVAIRDTLSELFSSLPLKLCIDCWEKDQIVINSTLDDQLPQMTLQIQHPGVIRSLFLTQDPLVLIEAYSQDFVDFKGNIYDLMQFSQLSTAKLNPLHAIKAMLEAFTLPKLPKSFQENQEKYTWKNLQLHTPERDLAVVQYHYDINNDFYRLWLDPLSLYSCAYFEHEQMSLKDAQEAKLDRICRKLRLQPGEYLLDIGCGWGALLRWAATHYGIKGYGITLSKEQLAFNQKKIEEEGLGEQLKVELLDYRNLPQEPTFDKISSIGMVEHVGVKNYPIYFAKALSALKPGGLFLNHGITAPRKWEGTSLNERFMQRYIFPDSEPSRLFTAIEAAEEAGWEIVDVDAWRPHYAKTSHYWAANMEATIEQMIAAADERKARLYQLYIVGFAWAFEQNEMGIYQVLHRRRDDREWNLPLTRKDWLC